MVRVMIVEGSPAEVIEVLNNSQIGSTADQVSIAPSVEQREMPVADAAASAASASGKSATKVFASEEVAKRVFTRRPMSIEQTAVVKLLASAYPNWVLATALQKAAGYTPAQFAGLMGAFGRRFSHTEGHVDGSWLFDAEWDYTANCYNYRLTEGVHKAAKSAGIA